VGVPLLLLLPVLPPAHPGVVPPTAPSGRRSGRPFCRPRRAPTRAVSPAVGRRRRAPRRRGAVGRRFAMSDGGSGGAELGAVPSLPSASTPSTRSGHAVFGGGAKGGEAAARPVPGKRAMAGYLYKEGKRLRNRSRRFLIATEEVLAQAPKEGATPSWTVSREEAHVFPGERPLEVIVATPRRTVSYYAEDTAEQVRWLRALRNSLSVRWRRASAFARGECAGGRDGRAAAWGYSAGACVRDGVGCVWSDDGASGCDCTSGAWRDSRVSDRCERGGTLPM